MITRFHELSLDITQRAGPVPRNAKALPGLSGGYQRPVDLLESRLTYMPAPSPLEQLLGKKKAAYVHM